MTSQTDNNVLNFFLTLSSSSLPITEVFEDSYAVINTKLAFKLLNHKSNLVTKPHMKNWREALKFTLSSSDFFFSLKNENRKLAKKMALDLLLVLQTYEKEESFQKWLAPKILDFFSVHFYGYPFPKSQQFCNDHFKIEKYRSDKSWPRNLFIQNENDNSELINAQQDQLKITKEFITTYCKTTNVTDEDIQSTAAFLTAMMVPMTSSIAWILQDIATSVKILNDYKQSTDQDFFCNFFLRKTLKTRTPSWIITRTLNQTLKINDKIIKKGSLLIFPLLIYQKSNIAEKSIYLPFGFGLNKCPTSQFSQIFLYEITSLLFKNLLEIQTNNLKNNSTLLIMNWLELNTRFDIKWNKHEILH